MQSKRCISITMLPANTTRITSNSKDVIPGSIFVAIKGEKYDGHAFIPDACQKGATTIVGETKPDTLPHNAPPFIQVPDSRLALAELSAEFYQHPSSKLLVLGVTGTSGKTTTTYLLESILKAANHKVGVIGTVNFRIDTKILPSTHTTPDATEVQRLLSEMVKQGCTAAVMEVSSHALDQKRVAGVAFDGMLFTNLSAEHQDYHQDMDDYFRAKTILFTDCVKYSQSRGKKPIRVTNGDDTWGEKLTPNSIKTFRLADTTLQWNLSGTHGDIDQIHIQSPLAGRFNASNILGAVTLAHEIGIEASAISSGVNALHCVPGRLEPVPNTHGIHVLVDYAHKPDALEKVLKTLREAITEPARLITVIGCGGDRDRKKRPVMGKFAQELSDVVIVTSDNPRTEKPDVIIQEILSGMHKNSSTLHVISDRKKAIEKGICAAKAGDVVLIAGKGHEDYQIIGTQKTPFDDREVAKIILQTLK